MQRSKYKWISLAWLKCLMKIFAPSSRNHLLLLLKDTFAADWNKICPFPTLNLLYAVTKTSKVWPGLMFPILLFVIVSIINKCLSWQVDKVQPDVLLKSLSAILHYWPLTLTNGGGRRRLICFWQPNHHQPTLCQVQHKGLFSADLFVKIS